MKIESEVIADLDRRVPENARSWMKYGAENGDEIANGGDAMNISSCGFRAQDREQRATERNAESRVLEKICFKC